MTKCPACNEELRLVENQNTYRNAQTYGGSNTVLTTCCNNIITVSAVTTYRHRFNTHNNEYGEDDWGNVRKKEVK